MCTYIHIHIYIHYIYYKYIIYIYIHTFGRPWTRTGRASPGTAWAARRPRPPCTINIAITRILLLLKVYMYIINYY